MAPDPMTASLLPYAPERDVYRLLQVEPNANDHEIAAACRRLALAFHPDHNRSPRAHEEMQVVNAVRHLFSDPRSRAAYDGARFRFLYYRDRPRHQARPTVTRAVAPPQVAPFTPKPSFRVLHQRARRAAMALLASLRGALAAIGPARCPGCRELVEPSDRYCAWCGTWVGRTETLPGAR